MEPSPLIQSLAANQAIIEANFSLHQFTPKDFLDLAKALEVNDSLTALFLSRVEMGDREFAKLCEALQKKRKLRVLDVSTNQIKSLYPLHRALANGLPLQNLNVSRNPLDNDTEKYLVHFLKDKSSVLEHLEVGDIQLGVRAGQKIGAALALSVTIYLRSVIIFGAHLNDEGAALILIGIKNRQVTSLSLASNNLGNKTALVVQEFLTVNKYLIQLDLSGNPIYAEGAAQIAEGLRVNTTLRDLNLSSCLIRRSEQNERETSEGFWHLAQVLKEHRFLESINLSNNKASLKAKIFIVRVLLTNASLKSLSLFDVGEESQTVFDLIRVLAITIQKNGTIIDVKFIIEGRNIKLMTYELPDREDREKVLSYHDFIQQILARNREPKIEPKEEKKENEEHKEQEKGAAKQAPAKSEKSCVVC